MEQLARPGSIVLTPSTHELAKGFIAATSLGTVPIKGLAEPSEIYELTGVGPARTRFQAVARRGLTQFVGREAELEQSRRIRQQVLDGHGQVVALIGDAGLGKSRLVYEFTHSYGSERCLVLECGAVSYGKTMSYLPIVGLLKNYFGIRNQNRVQTIDKVAARLFALDHSLKSALPALQFLLDGRPMTNLYWRALDPSERRQRIHDAVRHLLLREARDQPTILILEDLHWIDEETQALMDDLVENLRSARIMLIATFRPEYQHGWASKEYYSETQLEALPVEEAEKLLDALLGDDPSLEPLKGQLLSLGNPLYLEEAVRTLVETKGLEGSPGHYYRLSRSLDRLHVPATVQVILAARIDRLSDEDKRLLQLAAVIGKQIPLPLLRRRTARRSASSFARSSAER